MKERKDLRDCHYGLYPAVTFAILGLIATGMYLELELHDKRQIVVKNYQEFSYQHDWNDYDKDCFNFRREELEEPFKIIKSYAAQAEK